MLDKKLIKALSVETRRDIIKMLARRPYTASELSKITNKHVTTISQHLGTLEQSGLIHRKESAHKWKYYELSDKGEKLFKTRYYSWVVVLSLSAIAFIGGFYRLFIPTQFSQMTQDAAREIAQKSGEALPAVATEIAQTAPAIDIMAIMLIILSITGIAFSMWKIKRSRDIFY